MRQTTIDGYSIKNCINAGYTQHVALMFSVTDNGAPFEVIGDERIAVENGFTLNEYFNQETDITPGSICSSAFESTLLNDDGALAGFNYERDFMLMLGVEASNPTSLIGPVALRSYPERLKVNNIWVGIKNGLLCFKYANTQQVVMGSDYKHMFVIENSADAQNPTYYLFIVSNNGSSSYIDEVYQITSGSGDPSQVTQVSTTNYTISDYFYNRLEVLASDGVCEIWKFNGLSSTCKKFTAVNDTNTEYRLILYEHMCVLTGKQPRRTLGKIVTLSAIGVSAKLDQNADSYANTVFSSSRTLSTIRKNLLNAVGLTNYYNMPNGTGSLLFTSNPFSGMTGYTYRELLAYVGELVGRSLCEGTRRVTLNLTNSIPSGITITSCFDFNGNYDYWGSAFARNEYYDYDAEEYSVQPVNVIISKQTDTDLGTSYPDSPSGTNTLYILNNPFMADSDVNVIRARLSYVYTGLYNDAYTPAVIEMPSRLTNEPGDRIRITLEDDSTVDVPIFTMTTVWNGGADCTIECTGDKVRDQYAQKDFRKTIKDGAKIHELIVDIEQVYSSIMDTLTQDYSTTQQTSNAIALYVGNHAYQIVSGISINSNGVDITGSKYIKLSSAGYIGCGDNWRFEGDGLWYIGSDSNGTHKLYIGQAKNSYDSDVYSAIGTKYSRFSQGSAVEALNGAVEFYIKSVMDPDGAYPLNIKSRLIYETSGSIGYPSLYSDYSEEFGNGHGSLGISTNHWGYGYIDTLYYTTLTQQSSVDSKHNIQPIPEDVGSLIDELIPVSYVYNGDETEHKRYGLIHEQTVDVMPEICVGDKYSDAKDKAINYMDLVAVLLKEVQSLRSRVKELERKNVQNQGT